MSSYTGSHDVQACMTNHAASLWLTTKLSTKRACHQVLRSSKRQCHAVYTITSCDPTVRPSFIQISFSVCNYYTR
jgi:hypothetical protein